MGGDLDEVIHTAEFQRFSKSLDPKSRHALFVQIAEEYADKLNIGNPDTLK